MGVLRKLKKEGHQKHRQFKVYTKKIGNSFTPVNVTNCSAKAASVNEYSSASQDISSLPALANVHSPESEEPPASSTDGPDSAVSVTVEGSGYGPRVSPPSEPLIESASCPWTSTPLLLPGGSCTVGAGYGAAPGRGDLQLSRTGLPSIRHR